MTAILASGQWIPGTTAHTTEQARAALSRTLFDPASAEFQQVSSHDTTTEKGEKAIVICGMVNAKNRMGGFAGFRRFLIVPVDNFAVIDPGATDQSPDDEKAYQAGFDAVWPECAKHVS